MNWLVVGRAPDGAFTLDTEVWLPRRREVVFFRHHPQVAQVVVIQPFTHAVTLFGLNEESIWKRVLVQCIPRAYHLGAMIGMRGRQRAVAADAARHSEKKT